MSPIAVALIVFACTLAGALFGMWLRTALPDHHRDDQSREIMKLGIGLVATMTALILGLVTASAKNAFDSVDTTVRHTAMDLLTLDRLLARYGPETKEIRTTMQRVVAIRLARMWPDGSSGLSQPDPEGPEATQVELVADQ